MLISCVMVWLKLKQVVLSFQWMLSASMFIPRWKPVELLTLERCPPPKKTIPTTRSFGWIPGMWRRWSRWWWKGMDPQFVCYLRGTNSKTHQNIKVLCGANVWSRGLLDSPKRHPTGWVKSKSICFFGHRGSGLKDLWFVNKGRHDFFTWIQSNFLVATLTVSAESFSVFFATEAE